MDGITVADLEVDLGHLYADAAPPENNGFPNQCYEPRSETTSRLSPTSKTKSVYTFGDNGTLAWVTPAGELLQVANCINNQLVGVECKRGLESGQDYDDRGKVLEKAVNSAQGSGYGFGISLHNDIQLVSPDVYWVHNRWPRFSYRYGDFDIKVQYYIESGFLVQQYQFQNNGHKEASVPYIISSDVCFRRHVVTGVSDPSFHPVPTGGTPERLILFRNSLLLIQNAVHDAQFEMGVFRDAQKQSLWLRSEKGAPKEESSSSSVEDDEDIPNDMHLLRQWETMFRQDFSLHRPLSEFENWYYRRIDVPEYKIKQSHDHLGLDLAQHRSTLNVPGKCMRELCAVIKLSGPLQAKLVKAPILQPRGDFSTGGRPSTRKGDKLRKKISCEEESLRTKVRQVCLMDKNDPKREVLWLKIKDKHSILGKAYAKLRETGEARFHLFIACLIVESISGEAPKALSQVRVDYAQFLYDTGCYTKPFTIIQMLESIQSDEKLKNTETWVRALNLLALMHLQKSDFTRAEEVYKAIHSQLATNEAVMKAKSTQYLEKIAWVQARQEKYDEACRNYTELAAQLSVRHPTILSNLGFLQRRLGQLQEAISSYKDALSEYFRQFGDAAGNFHACIYLHFSLLELGEETGAISVIPNSDIKYINVNSSLSQLVLMKSPFDDSPLHFALERQLEFLLSSCCIPVGENQNASALAFVDADPLNSFLEGRGAYFQFRFLIQCHRYINSRQKSSWCSENAKRIHVACEAHLAWVFKIARFEPGDTWYTFYPVSGRSGDSEDKQNVALTEDSTQSRSIEGCFHFLKLYFYFCTWNEQWKFALELLHLKINDWFSYLVRTQHKAHLWVEHQSFETLKFKDTKFGDRDDIQMAFPYYDLSDSTLLWLTLSCLETLVESIGEKFTSSIEVCDDSIQRKVKEVQECFKKYQDTLNPQLIRSNLVKTFMVSEAESSSPPISGQENPKHLGQKGTGESLTIGERDQRLIVFRQMINERHLRIQPTDVSVIEAAHYGIFKDLHDHVELAWKETLKEQHDEEFSTITDPRQIALYPMASRLNCLLTQAWSDNDDASFHSRLSDALYDSGAFAQALVGDAPESMRSWSAVTFETTSLMVGSLFKECLELFPLRERSNTRKSVPGLSHSMPRSTTQRKRENKIRITMPERIDTSSIVKGGNIVDDKDFLPDWMYYYPEFIHQQSLDIKIEEEIKQLEPFEALKPAVDKWKDSRDFSSRRDWSKKFSSCVVDSGVKNRTNPEDSRNMTVRFAKTSKELWDHLVKPRTPNHAKKRLIELSGHDSDGLLICWLTASKREKPFLLEFFRRHTVSENYFGERTLWQGNTWETEFHLGFYQLVSDDSLLHRHSGGNLRIREVPSLSFTPRRQKIAPVALGFRIVGDLRDRFWSCHFIFSSLRLDGFRGIIYESKSMDRQKFHQEKQSQRKILELIYVQRATEEMERSIKEILDAIHGEFSLHDTGHAHVTRDLQSESFEFIYNYSNLHLRAAEILRDMLQRLKYSISSIEDWEKREDNRGIRSRWSAKDEKRFGERLRELTRKCKINIQQLRMQQSRTEEQLRFAEHQHTDLVSYMQLREARTSTRSAEDVRLFTYVTIIFLPLTFSSSLFSMQGAPATGTIASMAQVTVIALAITMLFLANIKFMDRNWGFWMNKVNAGAREKMKARKDSSTIPWSKVSQNLEQAAQRQVARSDYERRLPAQSNWWYVWFWTSYMLKVPTVQIFSGIEAWQTRGTRSQRHLHLIWKTLMALLFAPACILIFTMQFSLFTLVDTTKWILVMARDWERKLSSSQPTEQHHEIISKRERRGSDSTNGPAPSIQTQSLDPASSHASGKALFDWLKSVPRPVAKIVAASKKLSEGNQGDDELRSAELRPADDRTVDNSSIHSSDLFNDEEEEEREEVLGGNMTDFPNPEMEPTSPAKTKEDAETQDSGAAKDSSKQASNNVTSTNESPDRDWKTLWAKIRHWRSHSLVEQV
ncbi:hypothetical protein GJ744_010132 [Endocarpon pusillum]|uniref:Uncharacterized protein n=1 Tax=Endocarpon pusillum TaxID=364733 RepID=A0A8H7E4C7_9EURO|nr:hypothetical protein GJ744_010132 [Endocarpon pusillum]